ncbi:ATP-binding cassette domain-containing protein [Nocardioides sp. WS12]|uniref:ABC transporter ATP-binding protein n=1 Tax=Nocardioides sp. WS12 TaxID=2486272 RepID=UPI0015F80B51|nr:ATP-binding cassette domain-containing protein [Nocardioides sp. WS12]
MSVVVDDLRCSYDRRRPPAVEIDLLDMGPGVCGLVGVNGAGKSTLLRSLSGSRRPEHGRVRVDDISLYGPDRHQVLGRIGYMPQQLDLPGEMRVADALAYASWVRGVPPGVARARNPQLLERVGLSRRAADRVGQLSGGMNRRLALAVALVTDPDVLLLDEPTTGLDPEQRVALRGIVSELTASAVTVLSSHVMEDVAMMANRIAVLHEGRLLHDGTVEAFVAERGGPQRSPEFAFLATIAAGAA